MDIWATPQISLHEQSSSRQMELAWSSFCRNGWSFLTVNVHVEWTNVNMLSNLTFFHWEYFFLLFGECSLSTRSYYFHLSVTFCIMWTLWRMVVFLVCLLHCMHCSVVRQAGRSRNFCITRVVLTTDTAAAACFFLVDLSRTHFICTYWLHVSVAGDSAYILLLMSCLHTSRESTTTARSLNCWQFA